PSGKQPPAPVVLIWPQLPPVAPATMVQMPVQQSVGLKHRSPSDAQAAPDEAHRPPAQLPEQQSLFMAHLLPHDVQVSGERTIAAQLPPRPCCAQQSVPTLQLPPMGLHTPAAQLWRGKLPLHRSAACVQAAPPTAQAPPVSAQVPLVVSQAPCNSP